MSQYQKEREKVRVFIGFFLPEEIKKDILEIQRKIPVFKGKLVEEENLHLTLKFLGEVSEKDLNELKEILKRVHFRKIECSIESLGFFSESFVRIIWLYLKNSEDLQREVDEALKDLFKTENRFMSHLTIARIKSVRNKNEFIEKLKKIDFNKVSFFVDEICLIKSELKKEGPEYEILDKYILS